MAKKITIALIVLIDLYTALSLLRVRPGAFAPATIWSAAEVNMLHIKSRAIEYVEGIRLIHCIARQPQRLQEEKQVAKPMSGSAIHDCSIRMSNSSSKADTGSRYRNSRIYRERPI